MSSITERAEEDNKKTNFVLKKKYILVGETEL